MMDDIVVKRCTINVAYAGSVIKTTIRYVSSFL
jgi:hypothetical protein